MYLVDYQFCFLDFILPFFSYGHFFPMDSFITDDSKFEKHFVFLMTFIDTDASMVGGNCTEGAVEFKSLTNCLIYAA